MKRLLLTSCLIPLLAVTSACGGSSPTPTPTPTPTPPANRAPAFTSAATANVPENSTGTIYTATASDPDGNPVTFSLAGGADQARFQISAAGALTFVAPPDFEAPADADANNVYLVRIAVSDGSLSATLDLVVSVTNVGPDGFRVTRLGTGFNAPVFIAPMPAPSTRLLVVERGGIIRSWDPATNERGLFLDISNQTTTDGERGLLGFAPAQGFGGPNSGFYVFLTNLAGDLEVRRYETLQNPNIGNPANVTPVITIPHPGQSNHNGGWIARGPDGFLYIATGDGGGAGDPNNNAQNTNVLLGKMLRLDPTSDAFPADASRNYAIPATNPFATSGGRPEIWAYGLRNPYRNSFDPATGNLWIADVGQGAREEVNLMRPTDGGANFGWRVLEGTAPFNGTPTASMVPPILEYGHGSGPREGNSITGGHVYRGTIEQFQGQYFFGDFVNGNIWSIRLAQVVLGQTIPSSQFILRRADFTPNAGTINNISSFGTDNAGNLLIVDLDGDIFRVEPQ